MSLWESSEVLSKDKLNLKTLYIGSTAPPNPSEGQLWYDTSLNLLKVYRSVSGWRVVWLVEVDKVTLPAPSGTEYSTPYGVSALTQSGTSFLQLNSDGWVYVSSGNRLRAGQRIAAEYIGGRLLKEVSFQLRKYGNPTGYGYVRVRRVDNDDIVYELGSIDVSTLTANWAVYDFGGGEYIMPTGVDLRILFEYSGGGVNDRVELATYSSGVYWGAFTEYISSYTDYSGSSARIGVYCIGYDSAAKDDNVDTFWAPKPVNQSNTYITFDLAGSVISGVSACRVYWSSDANWRPSGYKIQSSVDGSSWSDLLTYSTQPPAGWVEYSFYPLAEVRFLRIFITQPGYLGTKIHEFDYYQSSIWRHGHRGD